MAECAGIAVQYCRLMTVGVIDVMPMTRETSMRVKPVMVVLVMIVTVAVMIMMDVRMISASMAMIEHASERILHALHGWRKCRETVLRIQTSGARRIETSIPRKR
jgi:uncharacterized membrane protein